MKNRILYAIGSALLLIALLALSPLALRAQTPQNVQKLSGNLTAGFHVPSGVTIDATGTGVIAATSVTGGYVSSIAGTAGQITASASTGAVTLSLPAALTGINSVTSATGQALTLSTLDAGPVNLIPYDPAAQGAVTSRAAPGASTILGTGGFQVVKEAVSGAVYPSLELVGYQNGQTAQLFNVIAKAGGTAGTPTNASAGATIGGYRFYAYANSGWRNVGNLSVATSSGFGSSDYSSRMILGPSTAIGITNFLDMSGGNGTTGVGYGMVIGAGGSVSSTTAATTAITLDAGTFSRSSSWGTTGVNIATVARTVTDTVSTGTVAAAVASSFAVPTFAASSATTYTNAANVYIAGDVAVGTNVTLTNSYGLWNVGKTRLDGAVLFSGDFTMTSTPINQVSLGNIRINPLTGTAASIRLALNSTDKAQLAISGGNTFLDFDGTLNVRAGFSGSVALTIANSADATLTGGAGNMTITAGTGNSRTLTLRTTTSGGTATTALSINATQDTTLAGKITTLGGATFHTTSSALTDGAAAAAGTLLNAPAAGNPTKWIGINDNGTTRYIPAW